jgi:multiple sugar transport system ATP-binding protein
MKDGVVQQCASPTEIYERPANRFVAAFVGTPPMNFIEGRIEAGRFKAGQLELPLPQNAPAAGEVVLGLRPDRIAPGGPGLETSAELVSQEHLGDRMDLRLDLSGHKLIARCAVQSGLGEGQQVPANLDLEQAHWFEPGPIGPRL